MAVLVVDDDATVVNLVTAVLHRAGLDAEVALDGPGALLRLGRGRYRAVLSDLTMPGMSGLQLLREARARGHELPFLIMTAYLPPETELALRSEPGVAGVLRKPFDIKRLVNEVRALLQVADPPAVAADVAPTEETPAAVAEAVAQEIGEEIGQEVGEEVGAEVGEEIGEEIPEGVGEEVEEVPDAVVEEVGMGAVDSSVAASFTVSASTSACEQPLVSALLPLSLMEFVSARLRRQALIAQAERRAAALLARPAPFARATELRREVGPPREAEQGC